MNEIPMYWGGMILSGSLDGAYRYENELKKIIEYRYNKYKERWGLFQGMNALYLERKRNGRYTVGDLHYLPEDPLVHINYGATNYEFLRLKSKKLNILRLEVYKFYRRNGRYPVAGMGWF